MSAGPGLCILAEVIGERSGDEVDDSFPSYPALHWLYLMLQQQADDSASPSPTGLSPTGSSSAPGAALPASIPIAAPGDAYRPGNDAADMAPVGQEMLGVEGAGECLSDTKVRSGESLSSSPLALLPAGVAVTVRELRGRRARLTCGGAWAQHDPAAPAAHGVEGWGSAINADGDTLISRRRTPPPLPPDFGTRPFLPRTQARAPNQDSYWLTPDAVEFLANGGVLHGVTCRLGRHLSPSDLRNCASFMHVSCFADEWEENRQPRIRMYDSEQMNKYTLLLHRAMYILPYIPASEIKASLLHTLEYQRNCMPSNVKLCDDGKVPYGTYRFTKVVFPMVFSMTVQYRVYDVPEVHLAPLSELLFGLPCHSAVMLERTKRHIQRIDSTHNMKSVLAYHHLPGGGALVSHYTCAVNTALPRVVAGLIHRLGSVSAHDVIATATQTRAFLARRWPPPDRRAEQR